MMLSSINSGLFAASHRPSRPVTPNFFRRSIWATVWFCIVLTMPASFALAGASAAPPRSAAYLLVIDHSGSMNEPEVPDTKGPSRWDAMQKRVTGWVSMLPLETRVTLFIFSGSARTAKRITVPLDTEKDRQSIIDHVKKSGRPGNRTALWDTVAMAFDEAERLIRESPGRTVCVGLYTDFDGQGEVSKLKQDDVERRYGQLIKGSKDFYMFGVKIGPGTAPGPWAAGELGIPVSIRLDPRRVVLKSPVLDPAPQFELHVRGYTPQVAKKIEGKEVRIRYVRATGDAANIVVTGGPYLFTGDPWKLQLEVKNAKDLDPKKLYSGHLTLEYPSIKNYWIQATPKQIDIQFDKAEPPMIYDMRPRDGQVFIAGKAINFYVDTLSDAKVRWDFGNGDTAQGHEVSYQYNTACAPTATVTVTSDPRIGATTKQATIEVVDLAVSVDPFDGTPYEGHAFRMTCTSRGPIERYEWFVDGVKYEGTKRQGSLGSELVYTFERGGQHLISVAGVSQRAIVTSEERKLIVGTKPEIAIVSPAAGSVHSPGDTIEFTAEVKGDVDRVKWSLRDVKTKTELKSGETGVAKDGSSKFTHTFPEANGEKKVEIVASGEIAGGAGNGVASLTVAVNLIFTGDLEIVAPERTQVEFRKKVGFKAVRSGKVCAVVWKLYLKGEDKPFHEAKGDVFDYTFLQTAGLSVMDVVVVAEGQLPGASAAPIKRRELELRVVSPKLNPVIKLPLDEHGEERTHFGLRERIQIKVVADDEMGAIKWDFGDNTTDAATDPNPIHVYTNPVDRVICVDVTSKYSGLSESAPSKKIKVGGIPPQPGFVIMRASKEVTDAPWGSIVRLEDRSSGDVMGIVWLADGEEISGSANQRSAEFTCNTKLFRPIRFEQRVRNASGDIAKSASGDPLSEKQSLKITSSVAFWSIMAILAVLYCVFPLRLLLGNQPRKWRIAYSTDGVHYERPRALVGEYWKRWRKESRIPLSRVFNKSQHWKKGEGRDTKLIVRALGKQKGALDGNIEISHYSDPAVTWALHKPSGQTKDYSLVDGRAPDGEKYSDVYIRLVKTVSSGIGGVIAVFGIAAVLGGIGLLLWNVLC